MRSYGQYCPISRAAEVLAERWTLLVVRDLLHAGDLVVDLPPGLAVDALAAAEAAQHSQGRLQAVREVAQRIAVALQLADPARASLPR